MSTLPYGIYEDSCVELEYLGYVLIILGCLFVGFGAWAGCFGLIYSGNWRRIGTLIFRTTILLHLSMFTKDKKSLNYYFGMQ